MRSMLSEPELVIAEFELVTIYININPNNTDSHFIYNAMAYLYLSDACDQVQTSDLDIDE